MATPLRCALVAGLLLGLLASGRWYVGGGTWAHFAVVGSEFADPAAIPFSVPLVPGRGYDGQFFLRLSMDPWAGGASGQGISLDDPAYRHQRIGLPALAWTLSLGQARLAPFALVLVNLLALSLAVGACSMLARELGRPPALGLGLLGISGLLLAFGRDLAEPLVVLFLSVAALSLVRGRLVVAALALTGAVLTREDALVAVAALAIASALTPMAGLRRREVLRVTALPALAFLAWQTVLWVHWGRVPVLAGADRLTLPFGGMIGAWPLLRGQTAGENVVYGLYVLWHGLLGVEAGRSLLRWDRDGEDAGLLCRWAGVGLLAWAALVLFLGTPVWGDEWAFARVLAQWSFFGLVLFLLGRWTPSRRLGALTVLLVIISAGRLLLRP